MKVVTEYLWDAIKFEKMTEDSKDPALKSVLKNQAESYRELAVKRAKKLGVPLPAVSKAN